MKRCPECGREYDNTMMFCLDDGAELLYGPAKSEPGAIATGFPSDEPQTAIMHSTAAPGDAPTRAQIHTTEQTAELPRGSEVEPPNRVAKPLAALIVAVVVLVGGFFGYRYITPAKQIDSIAVMPFVNESGNAEVEYLSDGMTESLISSLSQLPNLSVKARSSVFRYKGRETDARKIGSELNVQAILYGRVVQRGPDLILNVELIDAQTENVLWSANYNRKHTNLVSLQNEIARDVSQKLKTRLSGADEQKLAKNYTENTEAYKLYLQGRFYWNKRTGDAVTRSAEYFQQAIELDPNYALAYAGLADAYSVIPSYADGLPHIFFPKSKAAAKRALELDETLAEAHTALARVLFAYDWNFTESNKEYRRAIELNPNYPTAHHWYGNANLLRTGRFDEAIAEMKLAQELDPLSLIINADLGETYVLARRYDEAIDQLQKTIEMDESFRYAHWWLGVAYQMKGFHKEAIAAYNRARQLADTPWMLTLLAQVNAVSGNRDEALKLLAQLKELSARLYVPPYEFAIVYAALGEKDQAFHWLDKSLQDRNQELTRMKVDRLLDPLRGDPRFQELLRKVGFPE